MRSSCCAPPWTAWRMTQRWCALALLPCGPAALQLLCQGPAIDRHKSTHGSPCKQRHWQWHGRQPHRRLVACVCCTPTCLLVPHSGTSTHHKVPHEHQSDQAIGGVQVTSAGQAAVLGIVPLLGEEELHLHVLQPLDVLTRHDEDEVRRARDCLQCQAWHAVPSFSVSFSSLRLPVAQGRCSRTSNCEHSLQQGIAHFGAARPTEK